MKDNIHRIVLSGGPGAGKSTSLPLLKSAFERKGYRVVSVPETATELISSGVAPWTSKSNMQFQSVLLDLQLGKEKTFHDFAAGFPEEKVIIFYDRGAMDSEAFMEEGEFEELLKKKGLERKDLYDRYDAVFILESPARIYPELYTVENNPARKHTVDQSMVLDEHLERIWKEHPSSFTIPANRNFGEKIENLVTQIDRYLQEQEETPQKRNT